MLNGAFSGSGFWWLFPLLMIVFCCVLMLGCLAGGRGRWCSRGDRGSDGSALEILQQRYARGEIDEREYEAKRKSLT